jgi:hypothetical protein
MFAFTIVIDLDVLKYRSQCILRALKPFAVDQFRFDDTEKRFGHRVIPAVALTTHALNEMMLFQYLSKITASVLNIAIRMNDQSGARATVSDSAAADYGEMTTT